MKSSDQLETKTTKRNLDADFEEAKGAEKTNENQKSPKIKRLRPAEDHKGGKAVKTHDRDERDKNKKEKPKEDEDEGMKTDDDKTKPKKKHPRGSPGKIKKTTDREGLEGSVTSITVKIYKPVTIWIVTQIGLRNSSIKMWR